MTNLQQLIIEVNKLNKILENLKIPENEQFAIKYFGDKGDWGACLNCNNLVLFSLEEILSIIEYYTFEYPVIQKGNEEEAKIQKMKDRIVALVIEELSKF